MNWLPLDLMNPWTNEDLRRENPRVIVYTPGYMPNDQMRYRVVAIELVATLTDATHWARLEPPYNARQ